VANNPKITNAVASASADAGANLVDGGAGAGKLRIYDGTQPTTADTALGAQVLLAELTMTDPAFGAASNGVKTASAITTDASANATGTASWGTLVDSNNLRVMDFSVGTASADLILNTVSIVISASVAVTAFTYTQSKG
jgi:hypothetical protein